MFSVDGICVLKSSSILQYISGIGIIGVDANLVKNEESFNVKTVYLYLVTSEKSHQIFNLFAENWNT
jgi:hypothetical protein